MNRIVLALILSTFVLSSCAAPTTPQPTPIIQIQTVVVTQLVPASTHTPQPTHTPNPTYTQSNLHASTAHCHHSHTNPTNANSVIYPDSNQATHCNTLANRHSQPCKNCHSRSVGRTHITQKRRILSRQYRHRTWRMAFSRHKCIMLLATQHQEWWNYRQPLWTIRRNNLHRCLRFPNSIQRLWHLGLLEQ